MKYIISVIMEFPIRVSVFDKLLSLSVCLFVVVVFFIELLLLANYIGQYFCLYSKWFEPRCNI